MTGVYAQPPADRERLARGVEHLLRLGGRAVAERLHRHGGALPADRPWRRGAGSRLAGRRRVSSAVALTDPRWPRHASEPEGTAIPLEHLPVSSPIEQSATGHLARITARLMV